VDAINAAFVSDEGDHDEREHHDQNHALFVFREFENSEESFHFSVAYCKVVILSGAKNLRSFLRPLTRAIARDVSLYST